MVAERQGEVYSYVVHHHPPVPGRETPFVVALVELEEGVRMVGERRGLRARRGGYRHAGACDVPTQIDDELTLPMWTPREA